MQFNDYQTQAARTLIDSPDAEYTPHEIMLVWNALGLAGEAGEVADTIKKAVFHRHALDADKLVKELGDVLWYLAALASKLGVGLDEVAERNIAKLRERYPEGYSSAASVARVDVVSSGGPVCIYPHCPTADLCILAQICGGSTIQSIGGRP